MKEAEEIVQAVSDALDEHDIGYHAHLAQQAEQDAPRLQQELQRISKQLQDIQGAQFSWGSYLQQKYGLSEGDRIESDGTIVRKASA